MKLLLLSVLCISIVGCDSHLSHSDNNSTSNIPKGVPPLQVLEEHIKDSVTAATQLEELDDEHLQKIEISKENNGMWITASRWIEHRIFGYTQPDTTSRKMIVLSVFTSDVEGNPFKCLYGSYYESSGMNDKGMELKYVADEGAFIKANIIQGDTLQVPIYIERKYVVFE